MNDKRVGIFTTHNEPSTLTREEKVARAKRRMLVREAEEMAYRLSKFEAALEATSDPVKQATLEAQITLAKQRIASSEEKLAELTVGVVN